MMKQSCIPGCGILIFIKDKKQSLPTKSVSVDCSIKNLLVNISSKSVYHNETEETIEAVYVFPLDEGSAVYHFEALVDGKRIVSECQEKEEARETYDRAVESGHTAFLLEEDYRSGDTFRCALGNLPPNSEVVITMKYMSRLVSLTQLSDEQCEVKGNSNALRLTLPSVLNPRYDPPSSSSKDQNYWDRAVDYAISSKPYEFNFIARVEGSKVLETVSSLKDKFVISFTNNEKTSANVDLSSTFVCDHDLVLDLIYKENNEPHVIYELAQSGSVFENDALMINFLPYIDPSIVTSEPQLEFVFLIDRSGSMSGSNIQRARESLLLILKSLPMGCRFQIVGFGSDHDQLFNQMMDYNEENLQHALNYQEKLEADMGGTEILSPLKFIYSSRASTGFLRNVILLTDGDVGNTDEVISLVAENVVDTRMFAIGLGEGASTALVSGVARAGGGRAEFVKESKDLRARVMSILNSTMEPHMSNMKLSWQLPDDVTVVCVPSEIPPLFSGHYLTIFALLSGQVEKLTTGSVTLSGDVCGIEVKHEVHFHRARDGRTDPDGAVRRLAAKYQILELSSKNEKEIDKKSIILISTKYNIVSKFTSMVAVDPEKKEVIKKKTRPVDRFPPCNMRMMPGMKMMSCAGRPPPPPPPGIMMNCAGPPTPPLLASARAPPPPPLLASARAEETKSKPPTVDKNASKTLQLASLQKFDGSWCLDSVFAEVIHKNLTELSTAMTENVDLNCWATILAIAFLETKCIADKTEWMMMVKKARKYLLSQMKDDKLVENLIQTAQGVL